MRLDCTHRVWYTVGTEGIQVNKNYRIKTTLNGHGEMRDYISYKAESGKWHLLHSTPAGEGPTWVAEQGDRIPLLKDCQFLRHWVGGTAVRSAGES